MAKDWAYYNEFDPEAAAWLRELIKRGLIANGEVDERSIVDVRANELRGFTQCHFFAGVGGWSYALRLAGWPDDKPVWTGSPPCQPFSAAGKGLAAADDRHLAPHFIGLVGAARPPLLFGEQVASAAVFGKTASSPREVANLSALWERDRAAGVPLTKRKGQRPGAWCWLDDLSDRLEAARYAVGARDIPAAFVGAPHIRQRTFFGAVRLADARDAGLQGGERFRSPRPEGAPGGYCPECGGPRGLADAEAIGRREECADGGRGVVGDCAQGRPTGYGASCGDLRPSPFNSPWRDADWLFCRDAKWRPVEPQIFGVADGVPAELVSSGAFVPASFPLSPSQKGLDRNAPSARRVMRLRGYGNAINPWAAAHFIAEFNDALASI